MTRVHLRKGPSGLYYLETESGEPVATLGRRRPSVKAQTRMVELRMCGEYELVDSAPPAATGNRCRSHKVASGQVAVEVWMTPWQRDRLTARAETEGKSRNSLVVEWVDSL